MLDISVIGIGNAGSQVASLASEKLSVPVLAINSSEKDLETIPSSIPHILIGDQRGSGKERLAAKKFLKGAIMDIVNNEEYMKIIKKDVN